MDSRGDVHEYALGSRLVRAVVVSAEHYAPGRVAMAPVVELSAALTDLLDLD
jgi:hypothetical protein